MTRNEGDTASGLEARAADVGRELGQCLRELLEGLPGSPRGPQQLARVLGLDKVLTSRVLKAARVKEPIAVLFHAPGPEPLRRLVRSVARSGGAPEAAKRAGAAVDRFERLIRQDGGDRSSLDAVISAWLPETRRDFELRRKQAAFKAMSQLRGTMAETNLACVLLHPSDDGKNLDVVWVFGLLGFQRLRPGVSAKVTTRRMTPQGGPRQPVNLDGRPITHVEDARLDEFCEAPPAPLDVRQAGDVVHYMLGGDGFGPRSAVDLVLVEVNFREIPRFVPRGSGRKGNVFAEVSAPAKSLLFDVFVHEDVYPGSEPQLVIYDTALEGVANVNDPARDVDRLQVAETIQPLGRGAATGRNAQVPGYAGMLRHVFGKLGWDDRAFRGYRCAIDYPIYGTQVAMAFDPPPPPES